MVPMSQNWLPTLEAAGIPRNGDPYGGNTADGFFALSIINPSNWTRSYSKPAYIDPLPPRSNLHILLQNTVTRVLFDSSSSDGLRATAVEFSSAAGAPVQSVKVNKEAILCGGTINSPQILQLSGVGPSDVLSAAGVDVKLDLPGVGTHLQDHIVSSCMQFDSDFTEHWIRAPESLFRANRTPQAILKSPGLTFLYVSLVTSYNVC